MTNFLFSIPKYDAQAAVIIDISVIIQIKKNEMKKLLLTYGCIAGGIISAMVLITFGTNMNMEYAEIFGYSTMIIAFSTIFFAIRSYRDGEGGGAITFGRALKIGLGITAVATVIYVITWFIVSNTIAQDFMTEYYQHSIEAIKASDLSQAEIDTQIDNVEKFKELYKNPIVKIGMTVMEIFPVGFVVSLISALLLKKK